MVSWARSSGKVRGPADPKDRVCASKSVKSQISNLKSKIIQSADDTASTNSYQ
jgi:hypothetical protein